MKKISISVRTIVSLFAGFLLLLGCARAPAQEAESGEISAPSAPPAVKIATLGHQSHGKSTLTAAITRVLSDAKSARFASYDEISNAEETSIQGVRLAAARVEYETAKARYEHLDCRTNADCEKLLSSKKIELDGVILVVSAADGPMPQTREQIVMAQKRGVSSIVVYLNKIDLVNDPELLDLVELEIRELLTMNGFKGDQVPVIRGSALMALKATRDDIGKDSILELLEAMDARFVR